MTRGAQRKHVLESFCQRHLMPTFVSIGQGLGVVQLHDFTVT
jgi:hypothetical protein